MSRHDRSPVRELAHVRMDIFDCSMSNLSAVLADPLSNEVIDHTCGRRIEDENGVLPGPCENTYQCRRFVAPLSACDACREKAEHVTVMKRYRKAWEHVCPERFRKTDFKHADFPKALFTELSIFTKENPTKSLFLYGPTGTGKTRVAFALLKRILARGNDVGVLWPEKLRTLSQGFETTTFDAYAAHGWLIMDDVLLTACRESKLVDAVKQLIDVRMRHERPFIITSQIGDETDLKDGKEFGEAKTADLERIKALLRRLREDCKVVSFAKAEATAGAGAF